jgi:formylglycine-generating enzyme required for sulfatase activity
MRPRFATASAILLAACGGASHASPEAGIDAAADAASDVPSPTGCEDFVADGHRACVPAGTFWFGWIADDEQGSAGCWPGELHYALNSCAHELDLPTFAIDLREVSVGDYGGAVAASAVPAPPEFCDDVDSWVDDSDCDVLMLGPTGFDDSGEPLSDWIDRPAMCVRKTEAQSYCAWKGGRLPLSTEWMKAARGASPSRREIPWADHVSLPFSTWNDLPAWDFALDADGDGDPDCEGLVVGPREPVTSRPENASPYGLLHVLGNVHEWVEVAPSGDLYEESGVDVLGFGELRLGLVGEARISAGLPVERGYGEFPHPYTREHTVGFRCAYDL